MRMLLTGCAGFIGYHTARELARQGHEIVGLDNLNGAYDARIKDWRRASLERDLPGFRFVLADVARRSEVQDAFQLGPYDAVLNLAALAGVRQSVDDPWGFHETNVLGTLNLLEAARRADVGTFLLASTSGLYGLGPQPSSEAVSTDRPLSPYAATKKAAEALVATYAHLYGLRAPVPRYFTVYGPAGRPDMSIFRFIRWIAEGEPVVLHGDGSQRRDFTYVEDIARGTVACLNLRGFEVVNLGGDRPVALMYVVGLIERALGRKAIIDERPRNSADLPSSWADITKARTLLGWAPQVTLEEGVRRTVTWYMEHRAWAKDLKLGVV